MVQELSKVGMVRCHKIPVDTTNPPTFERSPKHESPGDNAASCDHPNMSSVYMANVDMRGLRQSPKLPRKQFVNYFTAHNELLQSKLLQIHEQ